MFGVYALFFQDKSLLLDWKNGVKRCISDSCAELRGARLACNAEHCVGMERSGIPTQLVFMQTIRLYCNNLL